MPPTSTLVSILLILIVFSAFFSASEAALIALNKVRLRHMLEKKRRGAKRIYGLLARMDKLIATILVGNNLVNILASSLATGAMIALLGEAPAGIAELAKEFGPEVAAIVDGLTKIGSLTFRSSAEQQAEPEQSIANGGVVSCHRLPPRMAEPSVGQGARDHADKRGQHVGCDLDAREAEGVVEEVERDQRHQPHQGDEPPALGLYALDEPLEPGSRLFADPVRRHVAGDKEGCGCP